MSGNNAVETLTFTLRNTLDAPILFNPHSWAIKRQTATGWEQVASGSAYEPLHELDPGNVYQWVLSRQSHPTSHTTRTTQLTVPVENGRHAFVLTGSIADESPNTTRTAEGIAGTTTEWVTLFDVQRIYR